MDGKLFEFLDDYIRLSKIEELKKVKEKFWKNKEKIGTEETLDFLTAIIDEQIKELDL